MSSDPYFDVNSENARSSTLCADDSFVTSHDTAFLEHLSLPYLPFSFAVRIIYSKVIMVQLIPLLTHGSRNYNLHAKRYPFAIPLEDGALIPLADSIASMYGWFILKQVVHWPSRKLKPSPSSHIL